VFVGNIPYEVTEEMLKQVFSAVGEVVSFRLMFDKNTKLPKGYGFFEYKDPETAYAAMRNLNNVECGGRPLRVDWADHELRNTEGVLKAPGRAHTLDPALKEKRLKNPLLQDFHERLTDENAEQLSEDAKLHCDIAALLSTWNSAQLLNVLGHMQRLVYESPDTARNLLASNPQLALAVSQVAFLLGLVAEPALPMSASDEEFSVQRILQLRNSRIAPQNPMGARRPELAVTKFTEEEKQRLRDELARMTPEQINALPEDIKNQMKEIMI
jgi:cleavage stimulation factor subunit 2